MSTSDILQKKIATYSEILQLFETNPELKQFIPDSITIKSLNRKLLLYIIYINSRDNYDRMKFRLDAFKKSKKTSKYNDLGILIDSSLAAEIRNLSEQPVKSF